MSEIQNRLIKTTQKPIQLVIGSDQQVSRSKFVHWNPIKLNTKVSEQIDVSLGGVMSISKLEFLNASSSLIIVKIKTEKLGWKIARRFKFSKSAKNYNLKSILVSTMIN